MTVSQLDFRTAMLDAAVDVPDGLIDANGNPAGQRFSVYRNNVAVSLTEALIELMAPDRAATLAHNGWRVVSEGAEATEAAADAILRAMDEAAAASDRAG